MQLKLASSHQLHLSPQYGLNTVLSGIRTVGAATGSRPFCRNIRATSCALDHVFRPWSRRGRWPPFLRTFHLRPTLLIYTPNQLKSVPYNDNYGYGEEQLL